MAGDILEIKIASTGSAGSKTYKVKGGESHKLDLGGKSSEIRMNGDKTGHAVKTAKPWGAKDLNLAVANVTDGIEFLQDIQDEDPLAIITVTYADGRTYKGSGTITGDLEEDAYEGYAAVTFQGVGKMERIIG
jgi:hypothetical protein